MALETPACAARRRFSVKSVATRSSSPAASPIWYDTVSRMAHCNRSRTVAETCACVPTLVPDFDPDPCRLWSVMISRWSIIRTMSIETQHWHAKKFRTTRGHSRLGKASAPLLPCTCLKAGLGGPHSKARTRCSSMRSASRIVSSGSYARPDTTSPQMSARARRARWMAHTVVSWVSEVK